MYVSTSASDEMVSMPGVGPIRVRTGHVPLFGYSSQGHRHPDVTYQVVSAVL